MWITSSLTTAYTPTNIALGNFDGVHVGHQAVIRPILPAAPSIQAPAIQYSTAPLALPTLQGYSDRCPLLLDDCDFQSALPPTELPPGTSFPLPTALTFSPHPREFFSGKSRPLLTPLVEKVAFMSQLGVQQLVLLPFNAELSQLDPAAFVRSVLIERLQARHISVGADFRFGHQRQGHAALLKQLAEQSGKTRVTVVDLAEKDGDRISSSRIRQALCAGDTVQAEQLMGRPYRLLGRVVRGQQLGRQLGFPTANLQVPREKFLPRTGVYSARVYGVPGQSDNHGWPAVMNLGVRPTVDGQNQSLEVHLLNWQGDLYDRTLTVALQGFLRPEQRFDSLDQLKTQIQADCQAAQARL
ncbi:MAG: bifunctional riboflavin kinase/FAD synthetase [Cyanobacteria bacterium P01_C01_bin.120]